MMQQTCQRCGEDIGLRGADGITYGKDEETHTAVQIGDWWREWVLCESCASILHRLLDDWMGGDMVRYERSLRSIVDFLERMRAESEGDTGCSCKANGDD